MRQRKFNRVLEVDTVKIRSEVKEYTQEQKNEIMKNFFGHLKDVGMCQLDDEDLEAKVD